MKKDKTQSSFDARRDEAERSQSSGRVSASNRARTADLLADLPISLRIDYVLGRRPATGH